MSYQLQQRLQKRFTTAARVSEQVSYFRVINRIEIRNESGDYVFRQAYERSLSCSGYANGGGIHISIYQDRVARRVVV